MQPCLGLKFHTFPSHLQICRHGCWKQMPLIYSRVIRALLQMTDLSHYIQVPHVCTCILLSGLFLIRSFSCLFLDTRIPWWSCPYGVAPLHVHSSLLRKQFPKAGPGFLVYGARLLQPEFNDLPQLLIPLWDCKVSCCLFLKKANLQWKQFWQSSLKELPGWYTPTAGIMQSHRTACSQMFSLFIESIKGLFVINKNPTQNQLF